MGHLSSRDHDQGKQRRKVAVKAAKARWSSKKGK
jgi:hypothetical protein